MDLLNRSHPVRLPPRLVLERRLSQRFCPRRVLTGQIEPADGGAMMVAVVQNLAARNIGLVCPRTYTLGSELRLRLLSASATFYLVVTLRVTRCEPVLAGGHYLGCEFTRKLEPGELRPFLA
jgi:hypothetical protein